MPGTSYGLSSVMDLLDVGVGIFDADLKLTYCNKAFRILRGYSDNLCRDGVELAELLAYNAQRGDFGPGDPEELTSARMDKRFGSATSAQTRVGSS